VLTQHRYFLFFSPLAPSASRPGRAHGQDSRPELARGIFHTTQNHAQQQKQGVDEEVGRLGVLSSKVSSSDWLGIGLLVGGGE